MRKSLLSCTLNGILALGLMQSGIALANNPQNSTACITQQQGCFQWLDTTIHKSPNDEANYRAIRLANGMEVLLISDEKANKSLMSVGLPIGSMEDPESQQGLAHYLEHMILMGSKKFPETNSLDAYLTKNGGYNNAYTAADRTVYYLEVNHNAFDEAVDRLADAFTEPLLDPKNAQKERNAVHAEMVRAKANDGFLLRELNHTLANPAHPITKFASGNKATLSDKPNSILQDELVKFYQRYYSANLMKAVLYSNQPAEKLAQLAVKTLGKVENKKLNVPTVDVPLFRESGKGIIVHYKPIKPQKMLALSFDMPEDKAQFKAKTSVYLDYIFSNNTENTLSDYLIKQGLSDSGIRADHNPDVSRNRGNFTLYVNLTEKGLTQTDKIISLIFQQIDAIKKQGIQQSYFGELKETLTQQFQHLQNEKSGAYVADLAEQMIDYPLGNILDQGYVIEKMDESALRAKLALMTVENARILIIDENAKTDQKTKYFEANYHKAKISPEQQAKWLDFSQNPTIKLPVLNPYFATDFSLNDTDKSRTIPKLIAEGTGKKIYAMPSHYFANEPKVNVAIGASISPENDSLKEQISVELLDYMHELSLTQLNFQTSVAGMDGKVILSENGIGLALSGYTQHLAKLATDLLTNFRQFELQEATLQQAKQRYLESLNRVKKQSAASQANRPLRNFIAYPYNEMDKKRQMIAEITLKDVAQTRTRLLTEANGLELLSVGNLSDKQVLDLLNDFEKNVKTNPQVLLQERYLDIQQSERKLNYITKIPHADNALSIAYFAKGIGELEGIARTSLLKDILSRWYFDDLRTDKQLGYVVYADSARIGKTSGMMFVVQSPTESIQGIMTHNERFFRESLTKLTAMPEAEFEKYRASLVELLQHKPESLSQEVEQFTADLARHNGKFDHKEKIIEMVKRTTKQDVIDLFQQAVINSQGFVFASQAIGTNSAINQEAKFEGFERVESIEKLQKEFELKRDK
ncbi:pitrilysin [Pasteurellaceae bacterium Macca]|nr:pitrilysin [Pasteurellaceae bacterium Macca]